MVGMVIAITNICAAFHRDAADYQGRIKPEPVYERSRSTPLHRRKHADDDRSAEMAGRKRG